MKNGSHFRAAAGVLAASFLLLTSSAPAATTNVSYGDFFFNPSSVTINVGDTVNWVGGGGHTLFGTGSDVICDANPLPCSYTFNTPGTYPYECTVPGHAEAGMTGSITVSNGVTPTPPTISVQPLSQTVLTNSTVTFSVTASNALTYQWLSNTVDLAGATNSSLVLSNVVLADSASYQVIVSNASSSVTSSNAVLVVQDSPPPVITGQPQGQTVLIGAMVTFSVTASNATSYQWLSNTVDLAGATNSSLTLTNVVTADSASYQVVVGNASTNVTSSNAVLSVLAVLPPVIVTQPQGTNAITNTTVTFSVTASNASSYQWLSNTVDLDGATNASFVLSNVVAEDSGSYEVIVSNSSGSVTSSVAALFVGFPAVFTLPLTNVTVTAGTPLTLQAAATGLPAPQYQWFVNNSIIPGQTNTSLALGTATAGLAGTYSLVASNIFGPQTNSSVLTVEPLTSIIKEKLAVTVNPAKSGSVTPNENGKSLLVANSYTVTAVAGKGQAFANWTGIVQSDDPILTFVMPNVSNATLTANFISSPFANNGITGTYTGLFWDTNNPANETSGFFSATVAENGVLAGQVKIAGVATAFSTPLRADGSATIDLKRRNLSTLVLTVQVDMTGLEMLTGTVSDLNTTFNATLTAWRAGFSASHPATSYAGYYTWEMPGATGNAPAGNSYGTAAIAAAGTARLGIFLSDGTSTTAAASISTNGQIPLYASLYSGKGTLLAWLSFDNSASTLSTNDALWLKDPVTKGTYPAGFTLTNLTLLTGAYTAEAKGVNALNAASASLQLSDADLTGSVSNVISLNANGVGGSSSTGTVSIAGKTGVFSGSFKDTVSGKTVHLNGVVLRALPAGYGFFNSGGLSGAVLIEPQ